MKRDPPLIEGRESAAVNFDFEEESNPGMATVGHPLRVADAISSLLEMEWGGFPVMDLGFC